MAVTRPKETADETRERIARVAEELFRRMGFAKTAVADIAAELGMSPANVYRFFPSKTAIVETICNRCLGEIEQETREIARADLPPGQRLEDMFIAILRYHRDNFLVERRVHDMVLVAMENNWSSIEAHKENIKAMIAQVLAQGTADGVFRACDSADVSEIIMGCMVRFCHPVLVVQCIDEDLEAQLRATMRFLLGALAPTPV
ncbi:TetR/AcrR family transcriptional regulator [Aquabacter sp. L1I39]|uniref:TetR/AcrR family transcriptional regulator n=1 Tax=Aquabacter sp. L1I39 TaxID=2820278 RepID=UPI001ADA83E3|nr:TetR/AcrR family transcriptional regulator [Aquabacter sp. L1I39]QTL04466.1 TetR/AcrR family transcriptional regulator [Aquabacter sp. L1I39]